MASISLVFPDSRQLRVRDVTLCTSDDFQTQRDKLARIMRDTMYQFVGLLAVHGTMLEINRAALEAIGIRMDDIRGKPFWEARWWVVERLLYRLGPQLRQAAQKVNVGRVTHHKDEAQKCECLRPTKGTTFALDRRMAAKLDQQHLVRMQCNDSRSRSTVT